MGMSRSERVVLSIIVTKGCILSNELPKLTQLAPRTVNSATRLLRRKGLIKRIPNLHDMRTYYFVPEDSSVVLNPAVQMASAEANT